MNINASPGVAGVPAAVLRRLPACALEALSQNFRAIFWEDEDFPASWAHVFVRLIAKLPGAAVEPFVLQTFDQSALLTFTLQPLMLPVTLMVWW